MKRIRLLFLLTLVVFSCSRERYTELELSDDYYSQSSYKFKIVLPENNEIIVDFLELEKKYLTENPNAGIENLAVDENDIYAFLKSAFAAGDFPDIFAVWPSSLTDQLIKEDRIVNLNPVLYFDPEWYNAFLYGELWESVSYEGGIFGLPVLAEFGCLAADKSLISPDKYPDTLNDILDLARDFSGDGQPLFFTKDLEEFGTFVSSFIAIFRGPIRPGDNSPEIIRGAYVRAVGFIRELIKIGAYSPVNLLNGETSKVRPALRFIRDIKLPGPLDADDFAYLAFPSAGPEKGRGVFFSPGALTLFIAKDPSRSREEYLALIDFARYFTYPGAGANYLGDRSLVNLSRDWEQAAAYVPLTGHGNYDGKLAEKISGEGSYSALYFLDIAQSLGQRSTVSGKNLGEFYPAFLAADFYCAPPDRCRLGSREILEKIVWDLTGDKDLFEYLEKIFPSGLEKTSGH